MTTSLTHVFRFSSRVIVLTLGLFLSYALASTLVGLGGGGSGEGAPGEAAAMALSLLGVCLLGALVLVTLLQHTRWYGLKLMAAVFVLLFGVETLLSQLETLFFNLVLNMPSDTLVRVVLAGAVRALLIAPLAVLVTRNVRSPENQSDRHDKGNDLGSDRDRDHQVDSAEIGPALRAGDGIVPGLGLAAVYLLIYILFGYFVAWQSPAVREFYTGTTDLQPFFTHLRNQFIAGNPWLGPFQLLRGCLWVGLALLTVRMIRGSTGTKAALTGLVFGILIAAPCLIPNAFLPTPVRLIHFVELITSMLLFGVLAGWVLERRFSQLGQGRETREENLAGENVSVAA